jgi:hypothetical protein
MKSPEERTLDRSLQNSRYREAHSAAILARQRIRRHANPDAERERNAKWRQDHLEYKRAADRAYYRRTRGADVVERVTFAGKPSSPLRRPAPWLNTRWAREAGLWVESSDGVGHSTHKQQ